MPPLVGMGRRGQPQLMAAQALGVHSRLCDKVRAGRSSLPVNATSRAAASATSRLILPKDSSELKCAELGKS